MDQSRLHRLRRCAVFQLSTTAARNGASHPGDSVPFSDLRSASTEPCTNGAHRCADRVEAFAESPTTRKLPMRICPGFPLVIFVSFAYGCNPSIHAGEAIRRGISFQQQIYSCS